MNKTKKSVLAALLMLPGVMVQADSYNLAPQLMDLFSQLSQIASGGEDGENLKPYAIAEEGIFMGEGESTAISRVEEGEPGYIHISGFDIDGKIAQFNLVQTGGPRVSLNESQGEMATAAPDPSGIGAAVSDVKMASYSFTMPKSQNDDILVFELTVVDDKGLSATDTVKFARGNSDEDTAEIEVIPEKQALASAQHVWDTVLAALKMGDTTKAMSSFSGFAQAGFQDVFIRSNTSPEKVLAEAATLNLLSVQWPMVFCRVPITMNEETGDLFVTFASTDEAGWQIQDFRYDY